MFTSIRKYHVRRGSAEELARRVQEGFVPLMRQMPGLRRYYLLDGGPDVLITISMFDSADGAFASKWGKGYQPGPHGASPSKRKLPR
jgi:heme-degrading monooxygenase HmoA